MSPEFYLAFSKEGKAVVETCDSIEMQKIAKAFIVFRKIGVSKHGDTLYRVIKNRWIIGHFYIVSEIDVMSFINSIHEKFKLLNNISWAHEMDRFTNY